MGKISQGGDQSIPLINPIFHNGISRRASGRSL